MFMIYVLFVFVLTMVCFRPGFTYKIQRHITKEKAALVVVRKEKNG